MRPIPILSFIPSVLLLAAFIPHTVRAQAENPLQPTVNAITAPARVTGVEANLVPLIWQAKIKDTTVSVPLVNIEFHGVQAYIVDGATRVRELTISTKAQSLIRIYHIRPLNVSSSLNTQAERLREVAEGKIAEDLDQPVKVFPVTTHAHMVEYRVEEEGHIEALHAHLEKTLLDYHARTLTEELRPQVVRSVQIQ